MEKKKISYRQYVLLVCILGSIFILSSQSGQDSYKLSNHFIRLYRAVVIRVPYLSPATQHLLLIRADHYVRKIAHLTVYMLLGGTIVSLLEQTRLKRMGSIIISLLCCAIYAATDEWHQYYVAGRGAQLSDVVIDSFGALIGILMTVFVIGVIRGVSNKLKGK